MISHRELSGVRDDSQDEDKTLRTGQQRSMWNRDQVTLYTKKVTEMCRESN